MSVVGNNRVGIPIVLLHDAEGAVVTVETKAGLLIRGLLFEAEDQMNIYIKKVSINSSRPVMWSYSACCFFLIKQVMFLILAGSNI